jgi:hypothetical protein
MCEHQSTQPLAGLMSIKCLYSMALFGEVTIIGKSFFAT